MLPVGIMIKIYNVTSITFLLLGAMELGMCEQLCNQDILYLVDTSGSIGEENFEQIKAVIIESSNVFQDLLQKYLKVGVMQYSGHRSIYTPIKLGSCATMQCFKNDVIANVTFNGGVTYTAAAIKQAVQVDFAESVYANVSTKHLILFTDGSATDASDLLESYKISSAHNVSVYVIGIGKNVDEKELRVSANGNVSDERVVLSTYENLTEDVTSVLLTILESCENSLFAFQALSNASCANVLGIADDVSAEISSSKPTLNEMKQYLNQPVWPRDYDQLQTIEIPLLSLVNVFTPQSTPVNYTIPINCSLANLTDVTSFPAAASLDDVSILDAAMKCVYLDLETGKFSTFGVTSVNSSSPQYYCVSNHTTIFASLMSLTTFTIPPRVKILSYVVGAISLVSLVCTFLVLLKVRKRLRSKRTVVQINLTISLIFFHTFILLSDVARLNASACQAVAVITHYFLLSSAAWMLLEGITLTEHTFGNKLRAENTRNERITKIVLGWGVPAVVVTIATSVGFTTDSYMDKTPGIVAGSYPQLGHFSKCWMTPGSVVQILSLILPVALVLLANLIILIRAGVFVFKMSKKRDKFKAAADRDVSNDNLMQANLTHAQAAFRAMLMLLPALGIPWCLSLMQITSHGFLYWYVITVGLQGLFLFLVYIPLNHEVRNAVIQAWNRSSIGNSFQLNNSRPQVSQNGIGKSSQNQVRQN